MKEIEMKGETERFVNGYLHEDEYHSLDHLLQVTLFHFYELLENGEDNFERCRGLSDGLKPVAIQASANGQLSMKFHGDSWLVRPSDFFVWISNSNVCPFFGKGYELFCELVSQIPELKAQGKLGHVEIEIPQMEFTLTVTEAAEEYEWQLRPKKFSKDGVRGIISKACKDGKVVSIGQGRTRRINKESLHTFILERRNAGLDDD